MSTAGADKEVILEGILSIKAAAESRNRCIIKVLADEKKVRERDRKATHFISFLKAEGIEYELCPREKIDGIVSENSGGSTHGGFVAFAGERSYTPFSAFLEKVAKSGGYAVCLDGVEDPYNFGYSVRSLYAFGAKGVILPERNWMTAASAVARSSAGSSELCEMTLLPDDETAAELIHSHGIDIVCSALSASSVSMYDFSPKKPFILFIGGEKRGISKTFMENADQVVHIPYPNENAKYSLPTASVAAIFSSSLYGKIKAD